MDSLDVLDVIQGRDRKKSRSYADKMAMAEKRKKQNMKYKIACTGASGSGKTTLVNYIAKTLNIPFISGSSGDMKSKWDRDELMREYGFEKNQGHSAVIRYSAKNPDFAIRNQEINRANRAKLITEHDNFVTDRSPVDNLTYFVAQCGFHKDVTDPVTERFANNCLFVYKQLTHVIYIKAVEPKVEDNGSRISNTWFQKASDAQFEYWLKNYFMQEEHKIYQNLPGPIVLEIDYWDWSKRKREVIKFLTGEYLGLTL